MGGCRTRERRKKRGRGKREKGDQNRANTVHPLLGDIIILTAC